MFISAIILAAGLSKRMGRLKLLMPLRDATILEETVTNYQNSEVDEVILVVGHKAEKTMGIIGERPIRIIENKRYQYGMSTSIVSGLKSISKYSTGVMIALGDQPNIDSSTVNIIIKAFINSSNGIVIPVYQGKRGHPVIFSTKYKHDLLKLKGDTGGREIISNNPGDVLEIHVECRGVCQDIDTIVDYSMQ